MKNIADTLRKLGHEVTEASADNVEQVIKDGNFDLIVVETNDKKYYGLNPEDHKLLNLLFRKKAGLVC